MEHTGTHMDAPLHFSPDGMSVDLIPVSDLVVPLAVIDIKSRASDNPDAAVTPDDIKEILLQQAIYCGVPAANHAVKEASAIIAELGLLSG